MLSALVMIAAACGLGGTEGATDAPEPLFTTTTTAPTTTTQRPTTAQRTTTTVGAETANAAILCDSIKEFLDENPDARVIEAITFGSTWRKGLIEKGWDPSSIGQKVSQDCDNGYNNEVIMGYGGFGPLADAVDYTLDRGTCGSRGDYGGVVSMTGFVGTFTVELSLEYVAADIVEHQATERIDVESNGNGVAFEFFMPTLPAGGTCDVELVSVQPQ